MTNKAYFISQLGYTPAADHVEAALIDLGLTAAGTYDVSSKILIKTAVYNSLLLLLSTPDTDQGNGETNMSIKYDRAAIQERLKFLAAELGYTAIPTIKNKSNVW